MSKWTGQPRKGRKGEWLMVCPVDGQTYFASQMRRRWDGVMVGPNAELTRHPQEFLRLRAEKPIPYSNPGPGEDYLLLYCTAEGRSAFAGAAVAGCSVVGLAPLLSLPTPEAPVLPMLPPEFFILLEDGVSKILLEDGSGLLGLE